MAAIILVADGREIASGVHQRAGEAHAEQIALDGRRFDGHTMVVTLEPCNHTGATPPCTEAIIASGISTVVVGATDPDPRVAGEGMERLRDAGYHSRVPVKGWRLNIRDRPRSREGNRRATP